MSPVPICPRCGSAAFVKRGAAEVDAIAAELDNLYGALIVLAAETGLRPEEWTALERRDVDRGGRAIAVQRKFANGRVRPYPKTVRSRCFSLVAPLPPWSGPAAARYAPPVPGC